MSRIGTRPIEISEGVVVEISNDKVSAKHGSNQLFVSIPESIKIRQEDNKLIVERKNDTKEARSKHGLIARLLKNIIVGVKDGFIKELVYSGTGYRVRLEGSDLILNMGYSHETKLAIPASLSVEVKKNHIIIKGPDKFLVGQFAAITRDVRGPEVYKGKGIKYIDEIIKRKAGKKASS